MKLQKGTKKTFLGTWQWGSKVWPDKMPWLFWGWLDGTGWNGRRSSRKEDLVLSSNEHLLWRLTPRKVTCRCSWPFPPLLWAPSHLVFSSPLPNTFITTYWERAGSLHLELWWVAWLIILKGGKLAMSKWKDSWDLYIGLIKGQDRR